MSCEPIQDSFPRGSIHRHHGRRRPSPLGNRGLRPISAKIERKILHRRGQPVHYPLFAGALVLHIEGERAVGGVREFSTLGADGEAVKLVRRKEVPLVVDGERPEALDWRELAFAEGQGVGLGSVEPRASAVEILIEVAPGGVG